MPDNMSDILKAADQSLTPRPTSRTSDPLPPETPVLNQLHDAIASALNKEDGRQILNRAQQKLEQEELEHASDVAEAHDLDDRIGRSEAAMKQMADLLATMKRNREDLRVVMDSRLESIHTMRKRGVNLP